jgi:hypothetical protein
MTKTLFLLFALAAAATAAGANAGTGDDPAAIREADAPGTLAQVSPGAPGGTGGVLPPGGRLPHRNGGKKTPEGMNPGPLPPGSNGGPPPKETSKRAPEKLNPQRDPNVDRGWREHQEKYGKKK